VHRSIKELQKCALRAIDGEIGRCKDFLFDDRHWYVRYLLADTRKWLPDRKVLVPPPSLGNPHLEDRLLPVGLTKEEIRQSPPLEADEPVSRKYEKKWFDYYRLPYYWVGPGGFGAAPNPVPLRDFPAPLPEDVMPRAQEGPDPEETTSLRSADEVIGYRAGAVDGEIGHIEDLIVDDVTWRIDYTVVDTRNWLPGEKVVLLPSMVQQISWPEETVQFDRTREAIETAPGYDPSRELTGAFRRALEQHYRLGPWKAAGGGGSKQRPDAAGKDRM